MWHRLVHWLGWAPSEIHMIPSEQGPVLILRCVVCRRTTPLGPTSRYRRVG